MLETPDIEDDSAETGRFGCVEPYNVTVLIVDDMPENLMVLGGLLRENGYHVKIAKTGSAALRLAHQAPKPSLILLDIMMPMMNGFEVFRELQRSHETLDIPVVFLTAVNETEVEETAFASGIVDFIKKPISPRIILARVRTHLEAHRARRWLARNNQHLESVVQQRRHEIQAIQEVSVRALANLAETRDNKTGDHLWRTQSYVRLLAKSLVTNPRYAATLTENYVENLVRSAPLHDIGKVGIPDHILQKIGPLTPTERAVMQTHTILGYEAIVAAERDVDEAVTFFSLAKEIIRWHHEQWDGSGYPDALSGEEIPLSARIMAIADVFDALATKRFYKEAVPLDEVKAIITNGRGTQFDPAIVDVLLSHWEVFKTIVQGEDAW